MKLKEKLDQQYPREATLEDGRKFCIRPMHADDEEALTEFFKTIPLKERQLFKDDVTNSMVIRKWARKIRYSRILPLLALDGKRIIADATLHRNLAHAQSHVAYLKVAVDPEYRGIGIAKALITDLVELAPALGVAILDAEVLPGQKRALHLFEELDFIPVATLSQHVRDLTDHYHDLIVLSHVVVPPEQLSPDAKVDLDDVDIGGQG